MATTKKMGRDSGKSATPTTSTNNITLTGTASEPRVDSRLLAKQLNRQHRAVMVLIDRYADHFRRFGHMTFQMSRGERAQGGGTAAAYALLNEDQSYFLLTLVRNSKRVVELKARLVLAFRESRQRLDIRNVEYLPTYHAIHDEVARLADGSPNERFVHMNVNRAINKAVGIEAGQRQNLNLPRQAMLIVAQSMAFQAMTRAHDHHDGHQMAKAALQRLNTVLIGGAA